MTHPNKGEQLECELKKAVNKYFLFDRSMYDATYVNACSLLLVFLHMFSMCHPKVAFLSKYTSSNFSFCEFFMSTFRTLIPVFS